jgi:(1->4)-alpha-D-glucan 1-alpha-D-glucosylmutase
MVKAVLEAKTRTSWIDRRDDYEQALRRFVSDLLTPETGAGEAFLDDLRRLVARIARPGFWNGLAREVIRMASPGTPDLYRGDELWTFALVDPDNRRPVDFDLRRRLLDDVILGIEAPDDERRTFLRRLVEAPEDGRIKLHVIRCALAARRERPELFGAGDYVPLRAEGDLAEHVVVFARTAASGAVLAVTPRLTTGLPAGSLEAPVGRSVWADTSIPLPESLRGAAWTSVMTRERLSSPESGALYVGDLLESFPADLWMAGRP